jgi:hypothetical protein
MNNHKTVFENEFQIEEADKEFEYQKVLTTKLDKCNGLFNQDIINEIVLWKVNRYALIAPETLKQINEIDIHATEMNPEITRKILKLLLVEKGIQLPMASTILRFRNKNIYQIIDQRVYRIIYKNKKLKLKLHPSDKNINEQTDLYLNYLKDLKEVCKGFKIPFDKSDRILFMADKRINSDIPLDNYSSKK